MYIHIHVYRLYMCIYIYIHTCVYIYIYIYTFLETGRVPLVRLDCPARRKMRVVTQSLNRGVAWRDVRRVLSKHHPTSKLRADGMN